jgi:hypothetical protein
MRIEAHELIAELRSRYPLWADGSDPLTDVPKTTRMADWVIAAKLVEELERVERERNLLSDAIRNAAVHATIIPEDATPDGPMLLMLARDLGEAAHPAPKSPK